FRRFSLWLATVAHELAPYNSAKGSVAPTNAESQKTSEVNSSGRLLFIFLSDAPAIDALGAPGQVSRSSQVGIRDALAKAGTETRFAAIEPHAENGMNRNNITSGVPVAGEWYMKQSGHASVADPKAGGARVTDDDAQTLAFLVQNLRLQSDFPAFLAGFQAG